MPLQGRFVPMAHSSSWGSWAFCRRCCLRSARPREFSGEFPGKFPAIWWEHRQFFFFRGIFDWERFWGRGYTSSLEVRGYTTAILRQVIDLGVACEVPLEVHHPPELRGITQSTWITSHKKELGFFVYFSSFLFDPRSSQQPFCSWGIRKVTSSMVILKYRLVWGHFFLPWSGWIMNLTMVTKGYWSLPDCLLYSKGGCENIPILLVISALLKQEDTGWLFTKDDCWLLLDCYQWLFYPPNPIGLAPKPPRNPTMDLE